MKKGIVALIGMVIALVLIIVAFIGPWYTLSIPILGDMSFGLFSADVGGTSVTYAEMGGDTGTIDLTMYLTIGALVTAIIALIGMAGVTFSAGKPNTMRMVGAGFGVLTFILAIAAALYFMIDFTVAAAGEVGFWNEYGGPGYAWYLLLIAAIIALIASAAILKKSAPAPAT